MQLREHTSMFYRGSRVWPPLWVSAESANRPRGEVGVLKEVRTYCGKSGETYLIIEHDGTQYAGCLLLDDEIFSEQLTSLLKTCCGMAVRDIGSLDLPRTLEGIANFRKAAGW
jgi:hypothetical protein